MNDNKLLVYFVSDLHLGSDDEPNSVLFRKFINNIISEQPTHLFLVGDIFDMWIGEHKYFQQKFALTIGCLNNLKKQGTELHYFEGNHDLYLKDYWQNKLGFNVHTGPQYFNLGPYELRVEHGDQTDPDDTGYLFLRWFLRTPAMKLMAKNMPGKVAAYIGEKASEHSRNYTSNIKTISEDESLHKLRNYAIRKYSERCFDYLITGHIHIRDEYEFEIEGHKAKSINLGTWMDKPCAFKLTAGSTEFIELQL